MYPGLIFWWNKTHRNHASGQAHEGAWAGCGASASGPEPGWGHRDFHAAGGDGCGESFGGGFGGSGFGVRRPLRFLAYKLQLTDTQVGELARILNELKTERAQADVDDRRALASFADAVAGANFEAERATQAATARVQGTQRLQEMVVKALGRIHALLTPEQRGNLAYLIRTGTLTL